MANINKGWSHSDLNQVIQDRYTIASSAMSSKQQKFRNLLQMYRTGSSDDFDGQNLGKMVDERGRIVNSSMDSATTKSKISASILYNAVETITPRLMLNFDPEGWFNVLPRRNTTMESARDVQSLLQWQLDETKSIRTLYTVTKQAVMLGLASILIRWHVENGFTYERKLKLVNGQPVINQDTNKPVEIWTKTAGQTLAAPKIELIPYFDFYPDPKGTTIENCGYVIVESVIPIATLRDRAKAEQYDMDAVVEIEKMYDKPEWKVGGQDPVTFNDTYYFDHDPHRHNIRVISSYEDGRYLHQALPPYGVNGNAVLLTKKGKEENPYDHGGKPIVNFSVNVDPVTMFPPGVIEPLRDEQALQSTYINMSVDAITKMLRPQRLIDKDLGIDIKRLTNFIPDDVITYDSDPLVDGRTVDQMIHELKPDPNGYLTALPTLIAMTDSSADKKSGITSYITGQAAVGSNKTARGVSQLTQNAEIRGSMTTQMFGIGATDTLEMMHDLNQQYYRDDEDKRNIYGDYNFKVFQSANGDKQLRVNALESQLPVVAQLGGDVKEVSKRILRESGVQGVDAIYPEDGTMEANQQASAQGELAQQAVQQQGKNNG